MVELADHGAALAEGITEALPRWVERCVDVVHRAWSGPPPPRVVEAAHVAGCEAAADLGPRLHALLGADIDDQHETPLALIREAVRYPTAVLRFAEVPAVARDARDEALFPGDDYGLTPATFADLGPGVADLGLSWGAAKAWTHRRRHHDGAHE